MKLISSITIASIATIMIMAVSTTSASAERKSLFEANGCEGCHGQDGTGSVGPRLSGQQEKYLVSQFQLIRDNKRTSGLSGMIAPAVKNVSDDDIQEISKYLSGL